MAEKNIADILMDDDELEVVEELRHEESKAERRAERKIYSTVIFEVGPDIKVRVVDIAIVIVAVMLLYLIFKNI